MKIKTKLFIPIAIILTTSFFNPLQSQEKKNKKLRELSPDRPHQTESPITVDKWHVMIESDIVNLIRKKSITDVQSTLGLGLTNVKIGFHDKMDIEIISDIYTRDYYKNKTIPDGSNYLSSFIFRYKLNLIGNDSGDFALAIMPTIKTNNFFQQKIEVINGGFLINIEKKIGNKFGLGYTGGISAFSTNPFFQQSELFSTTSLDYKLVKTLRVFTELSYRYNKNAEYLHTYSIDTGIIFTPLENLQFDTGLFYYLPAKSPFFFFGGTIRI